MIIDFHAHVKRDPLTRKYLTNELFNDMDENNIHLRVVSAMEGSSIADQNDFISELVRSNPTRLAGFAVINPKAENAVEEALRAASLPGIYGFEFNALEHGYFPEHCPHLDAVLCIAKMFHFPVKVFTGVGAMSTPWQWALHAKQWPEVTFIMLHMGCFDFGYGCVDIALQYENVLLETSNQYEVQILRKAFHLLPPEKFLFGSQYPNKITQCSLAAFDMFDLSEMFKEKMFYENANQLLKTHLK